MMDVSGVELGENWGLNFGCFRVSCLGFGGRWGIVG